MTQRRTMKCRHAGLSYVEILVAMILIAICAVPAVDALRGAIAAADSAEQATINHYRLKSALESVLADSFSDVLAQEAGVATASNYSDPPGTPDRRLVFISTYDGDNADADSDPFTGTDPDLLWVRVEIEGSVNGLQALMFK